jgi:hypothetical protein
MPPDQPHFALARSCAGCPRSTTLHTGCLADGTFREVVETPAVDRTENYQRMLEDNGQRPTTATEVIFKAPPAQPAA